MDMHSGIVLSQASGRPMFAQITDQVKRRVASGDWPPGTEIPSIRGLAAELGVSVITVKRAYAELEHEGVIVTIQGKPSVIAEGVPGLAIKAQKSELSRLLEESVELAMLLGIPAGQLHDALKKAMQKAGTNK